MNSENWTTLDDLAAKWSQDPESVLAEFRLSPYFAVAKDVFELRQELQLTQEQVATLAQTHQSRISKVESADLDFKLSTLIKIAEALQAHVDIRVIRNLIASEDEYQSIFSTTASAAPDQAKLKEIQPSISPITQFSAEVDHA